MEKGTQEGKETGKYDRLWKNVEMFYCKHTRKCNLAMVLLLFVVLLGARIYDINIKNQLHSDEVFSVMISTCNKYYNRPMPDAEYTGEELKTLMTKDDIGGIEGAMADIAQLWKNNGDAPHASLYYMVLRLALIGFDTFDVHDLAWRGGCVNLLFFVLSFFFMYKLLRVIFKGKGLLVAAGLAVAFGNWLSIRNTLLIREYQMAETGIILLTLLGVTLVVAMRERREVDWKRYVAGFAVIVGCIVSLGYFNAFYVIFFGIGIMVSCWHYGQKKGVLLIALAGVLSVCVALLLYPGFFNFLMHDSVHKTHAFRSSVNMFKYVFVRDLGLQFFTMYGVAIMGLLLLVVLFSKNRKSLFKTQNFAWIPVIAVVCMLLIQYASLLKMSRYYFALVPVFSLIVPHVISVVPKSWTGYFEILVYLYFPFVVAFFPMRENYRWHALTKDLNRPVTFHCLNPNEIVQMLPCVQDNQKYEVSGQAEIDIKKEGETFVASKYKISNCGDSIRIMKKLLWGKHIFLYKFNYINDNGKEATKQ